MNYQQMLINVQAKQIELLEDKIIEQRNQIERLANEIKDYENMLTDEDKPF